MLLNWCKEIVRDFIHIAVVLAVVAVPVALLLSHVHTQYEISQTGYDIAQVTRDHRVLAEDHKMLQIEAAVQGRTERMTTLARERYGLAPTRPEQITIIEGVVSEPLATPPPQHASLNP